MEMSDPYVKMVFAGVFLIKAIMDDMELARNGKLDAEALEREWDSARQRFTSASDKWREARRPQGE